MTHFMAPEGHVFRTREMVGKKIHAKIIFLNSLIPFSYIFFFHLWKCEGFFFFHSILHMKKNCLVKNSQGIMQVLQVKAIHINNSLLKVLS